MAEKDKFAGEIMSDEELDGVAGGTLGETVELFNVINQKTNANYLDLPDYLKTNYGIDVIINVNQCQWNGGGANEYRLNGEQITHEQVLDIIKSK